MLPIRLATLSNVRLDSLWGCGMDLVEFNTHSFIVKIWLEEPADDNRKGRWRGHITHVPDGERRYLKSLGEIVAFMVPYLLSMGVRLGTHSRLRSRFAGSSQPKPQIKAGEQARASKSSGKRSVEG